MIASNNEQWLSGGNCNLCRRAKYCSKDCKAHKSAAKRLLYDTLDKSTGGFLTAINKLLNIDE